MISNVLKTGPDRPVRSVKPSTGHKTGPVQSKNRFCIELPEPAVGPVNRMNRPVLSEPAGSLPHIFFYFF